VAREQSVEKIRQSLLTNTSQVGKSYSFDEGHDPARPVSWWFQESDEGLVLFVVFYTMACRWSCCTACNLPTVSSSRKVPLPALVAQIDALFADPKVQPRLGQIGKLIVSNNGSVLDEVTFQSTALMHLLVRANLDLPGLRVLSFESRPEYVDVAELEFLSRAIAEHALPTEIEIAIGFEAFDEHIRNDVFRKGLSLRAFEELVERIRRPGFRLKVYFMQKPVPGMSDEEAVLDIRRGIDYLHEVSTRSGVHINMHLNPTYVAHGTPLAASFQAGDYRPPRLVDVVRALLHARGKAVTVFVGLDDEGLAVPGGSFLRPEERELCSQIEAFNRSQDYDGLEGWCRDQGLLA
jgi:radical SAM enzyme (TIGR01210 family)